MQRFPLIGGGPRVPVDLSELGSTVTNTGAGTLKYADDEYSAETGSLTTGQSVTLTGTQYLWSPTGFQTIVTIVPLPSNASELARQVFYIREALPTLDSLGAVGDGTTDDTGALATAAATGIVHQGRPGARYVTTAPIQLVEGGGIVGHNKFEMEALANPYLTIATEIARFSAGDVIRLPNGGVSTPAESQKAAVKLGGLRIFGTGVGACIAAHNGGQGVELGDIVLYPGVGGKGIHTKGFVQNWRGGPVRMYGGKYGWYTDAELGANGDLSRMDDCDLTLYISGASKYNGLMRVGNVSDNVRIQLRSVSSQEHGFVVAGGFAGLIFDNPNFEANGFSQSGLGIVATTGAITAGTNTLTVANATGYANGQTITVAGAGAIVGTEGAQDLITTITSGGGTVNLVLAANASTSVAGARVTRALYDDFYSGTDLLSPESLGTLVSGGPANITFISPSWGLSNYLRRAATLYGPSYPEVINPKQGVAPVYDPQYLVSRDENPNAGPVFNPTGRWQLINDTAAGGLNRFGADWSTAAGQNCAVRRRGRKVEFRGYATAGAAAGGTVCTLPPGCRPSRTVVFRSIFSAGEVQGVGLIAPSGVVTSFTTSAGTNVFADDFSFTVD